MGWLGREVEVSVCSGGKCLCMSLVGFQNPAMESMLWCFRISWIEISHIIFFLSMELPSFIYLFFFSFSEPTFFSGKKYKYISKPSCRVYNDVIAHVTAMVGFAKPQGRTVISTGTHKPGGR